MGVLLISGITDYYGDGALREPLTCPPRVLERSASEDAAVKASSIERFGDTKTVTSNSDQATRGHPELIDGHRISWAS